MLHALTSMEIIMVNVCCCGSWRESHGQRCFLKVYIPAWSKRCPMLSKHRVATKSCNAMHSSSRYIRLLQDCCFFNVIKMRQEISDSLLCWYAKAICLLKRSGRRCSEEPKKKLGSRNVSMQAAGRSIEACCRRWNPQNVLVPGDGEMRRRSFPEVLHRMWAGR